MVERIIPADLDGNEMWKRNSEYVSADAFDESMKRIAVLESVLHKIADHSPPNGAEPVAWMKAMAAWALDPSLHQRPDQGTF